MNSFGLSLALLWFLTISYLFGFSIAYINQRKEIQQPEILWILALPFLVSLIGSHITCGMLLITAYTVNYGKSNLLLVLHWICIIWMAILCHNMAPTLINCIFVFLLLDICSVLQVCLLPKNHQGQGPWAYYLLFQSLMTVLIWWSISLDLFEWVHMFYYCKCGAGIGGYYLPSFYRTLSTNQGKLLMYIGCSNLLSMWYGFLLFQNQIQSLPVLILTIAACSIITLDWTIYGQWFISQWLYLLSFSSMITASTCCCILASTGINAHLFVNIVATFILTSQIVWCIIVASIH